MTDYSDVPTVTTLHGESERTQQAMTMLDNGGTMSNFTISPPPPPTDSNGVPIPTPITMMAVTINVTEPLSDELMTALNDWLVTRQQNIVDELATYDVGPPPPPITDPPSNVTAPLAEQSGSNLTCTMGTWDNEPSSYTYVWSREDGSFAGSAATYPIAFADVGVTFSCVVTATNTIGTTQGPPSNSVTVVSPS
jgi:hypothetical protein